MPIEMIIFVVVLILYLLFFFGIIGPRHWRDFVKSFYKWFEYKRKEVIFPIDPNKPIVKAVEEGLKEIPNRIKGMGWLPWNWSQIKGSYIVFILLQFIVLFGIVFVFIKFIFK